MTMTTLFHRLCSLRPPCALALAVLIGSHAPVYAQSIACMINGDPITNFDIEQRTQP
jgi:peptidyl-prolyl cis-trans isomerase SurA